MADEPNIPRGYGYGMVPPGYVWTGDHWESPQQSTLVGWPTGPLGQFTVVEPSGQTYQWSRMKQPEVYIEGVGWRPREQGSLMYPDTPEGQMYSTLSGFPWIDRTPKPTRPLTMADQAAWLNKVGATEQTWKGPQLDWKALQGAATPSVPKVQNQARRTTGQYPFQFPMYNLPSATPATQTINPFGSVGAGGIRTMAKPSFSLPQYYNRPSAF